MLLILDVSSFLLHTFNAMKLPLSTSFSVYHEFF